MPGQIGGTNKEELGGVVELLGGEEVALLEPARRDACIEKRVDVLHFQELRTTFSDVNLTMSAAPHLLFWLLVHNLNRVGQQPVDDVAEH
jgi:hypothetical protein